MVITLLLGRYKVGTTLNLSQFPNTLLDAAFNVKPAKLITDWIKAKRAEIAELSEHIEDKHVLLDQESSEALLIKMEPLSGFNQVIAIHGLFSETIRDIAICVERDKNGEKVEATLRLLPLFSRISTGEVARKTSEYIASARVNSDDDRSDTTNGMTNKDLLTQIALMNFRAMVDQSSLDLFDSKAIERHFLSTIQGFKYESQELHYLHSLNDFRITLETNWFQSHQEIDALWSWAEKYDEGIVSILIHEAYKILKAFEKVSEIIERTVKRSAYAKQILQSDVLTETEPPNNPIEDQFIVAFRKSMRNLANIDHDEWLKLNKMQYQLIDDIERTIITHPEIGKALLKRHLGECLNEQPYAETTCKVYQKKLEESGLDAYSSNLESVRETYYEIENAIGSMVEHMVRYFPDSIDKLIASTYQTYKIADLFERFVNRWSPLRKEIAHKRKQNNTLNTTSTSQDALTLASSTNSKVLSLRQIAYLHRYTTTTINELNKDEIASKYGWASGHKLLNEHFLLLATETQRLAGRDAIKNIRCVVHHLEAVEKNEKALEMAKSELTRAETRKG